MEGNGNLGDGRNASPEGDGSSAVPDFLSDDDIAMLGAPSGNDVDPAMTAIFKVRPYPAHQRAPIFGCCVRSVMWCRDVYSKNAPWFIPPSPLPYIQYCFWVNTPRLNIKCVTNVA